jgi:hypothetical protein
MHVMDALVAHGCLIVDLWDKGANADLPLAIAKMWENALRGFSLHSIVRPERKSLLPRMASIPASPYAKMGYADFQNGMKFMETRIDRVGKTMLPVELLVDN